MRNARIRRLAPALAILTALLCARGTSAQLIESFEGALNGWSISPFGSQAGNFEIKGFSTTGATDGTTSLQVGPTASNTSNGPNYSQMLISPNDRSTAYAVAMTDILKNAASLSFDVTSPPNSFGFFLQWDTLINNNGTGFLSLDGGIYQNTNIGSTTTITLPISPAIRAQLAGSNDGTTMIFQVGGGFSDVATENFFLDNIRTTAVPEPMSLGALGLGSLLALRRRH